MSMSSGEIKQSREDFSIVNDGRLLAGLIILIMFLPLLKSSYVSDDAYRAHYAGLSLFEFFEHARNQTSYWWQSSGRLFVVTPFVDVLPLFIFRDLFDYKLYCYGINVMVVFAFVRLVKVLFGDKVAFAFPVFLAMVLQFRDYHDAVLAFGTLYQFLLLFITLATLFGDKYSKNGKFYALVFSALNFGLALLTMEVAYSLMPFLLYVIWRNGDRRRFFHGLIFYSGIALVVFVFARYGLVIGEQNAVQRPSAYNPNFNAIAILLTFLKQIFATLPLSYFMLKPQIGSWGILANPFSVVLPLVAWVYLFILSSLVMIRLFQLEKWVPKSGNSSTSFGVASLIFFLIGVLPASVISLSPKYQSEIVWGNGYLPVYIQSFGVAAALAITFIVVLDKLAPINKFAWVGLTAFITVLVGINFSSNWKVVAAQAVSWGSPMKADTVILNSLEARQLCSGGILYLAAGAPWIIDTRSLIRRLNVSSVTTEYASINNHIGCIFSSAFSSREHLSELVGPVRFENNSIRQLDNTKRLVGTSDHPSISYCDDLCVK